MQKGRVININGGFYKVLLEDKTVVTVRARGKLRHEKREEVNLKSQSKKAVTVAVKNSPKVGDFVTVANDMIDTISPRVNELIRPDIANVDQIMLVFAAKDPDFSFFLLDLFIVNILKQKIKPLIVISKIDKLTSEALEQLKKDMTYYTDMGYDVLYVNSLSHEGLEEIKLHLDNKVTVLSGQTGAGKSTLINAIFPDFKLKTDDISYALGRGKHTTRETNLYIYNNGFIGDTPGFSKLDVLGIESNELSSLFVDIRDYNCKFADCNHLPEIKGCRVYEAYKNGELLKSRYENYVKMYKEIKK